MSPRSDPARSVIPLLEEMVEMAKSTGKELLPTRGMHQFLVVTPQQVIDCLSDVNIAVSFEDCRGDPTYFLKVEWEDKMICLPKYGSSEFTTIYGISSWDLSMVDEHPF